MSGTGWVKPLRHARWWLGLWWLAVALTVVAELLPAMFLPVTPAGGDKVEHVLGYALLAAAAVQVFRRPRLWRIGALLVGLGLLLEVAQGTLTSTRSFDLLDALANAVGVLLGLASALTPLRDLLPRGARS